MFIKDFFTQAKNLATCPHCNEVKVGVKKEGTNKFVLKEKEKQQILNPYLVMEHTKELFQREKSIIKVLFGKFEKATKKK